MTTQHEMSIQEASRSVPAPSKSNGAKAKAPKAKAPKSLTANQAAEQVVSKSAVRKAHGFDKSALRKAQAAIQASVRASDAEVGRVLLARGRKALRAEIDALLDDGPDGSSS